MAKFTDTQQQRAAKNLPDASIPPGTQFVGDIDTMAGLRVDGSVKGKINAGGNVTVGAEGSIEGTVSAKDVNIAGEIIGNLKSNGTVQMISGAKLVGDLSALSFAIEQGAYFKGLCLIGNAKESPVLSAQPVFVKEKKSESKSEKELI